MEGIAGETGAQTDNGEEKPNAEKYNEGYETKRSKIG
jgi:hypothetical protein